MVQRIRKPPGRNSRAKAWAPPVSASTGKSCSTIASVRFAMSKFVSSAGGAQFARRQQVVRLGAIVASRAETVQSGLTGWARHAGCARQVLFRATQAWVAESRGTRRSGRAPFADGLVSDRVVPVAAHHAPPAPPRVSRITRRAVHTPRCLRVRHVTEWTDGADPVPSCVTRAAVGAVRVR